MPLEEPEESAVLVGKVRREKRKMKKIEGKLPDELLEGYEKPEDPPRRDGLPASLKRAVIERIPDAELTEHLAYGKREAEGSGNSRNGHGTGRVLTDSEQLEAKVLRDRNGTFEPQLARKHRRRPEGFDEKVISLYAGWMTQREIRAHPEEM